MGEFTDKVAIVTGAASGIGRAAAQAFAAAGARVTVADVEQAGGAETVRRIEQAGAVSITALQLLPPRQRTAIATVPATSPTLPPQI